MPTVPLAQIPSLVGTRTGVSEWLAIEQDRIEAFADATLDHQWIHVDEAAAEVGPFGTTIAHGFLTLSLLPHLLDGLTATPEGTAMAINYGSDKVRFLAPVPSGARVRAVVDLTDFTDRGDDRYLSINAVTVELEGSEVPALVAEILTLYVVPKTHPESEDGHR